MVRATIDALSTLTTVEKVAKLRGKSVDEILE
jgi:ribosomal protein S5